MRTGRGAFVWGMVAAVLIGLLAWQMPAGCAVEADVRQVPVLMYHNFAPEDGSYTVSSERFREHLAALETAGYETVTFAQLLAWVHDGGELPEKPVVLVSDDGYTGVLEYALPVLEEFDMVMSVAVIGDLLGVGGDGRLPHFSLAELAAADSSGRIEPISHSFGLHGMREGMNGAVNLSLPASEYEEILAADCGAMGLYAETYPGLGQVFVYPYGAWSAESEAVLASCGYRVTVTTGYGAAQVSRGEKLTLLPRIPAEWYGSGAALLDAVSGIR